jgi:hypothetical protein
MKVLCLRYNGEIEETALSVDEASNLLGTWDLTNEDDRPRLHFFLEHNFSCYEECSMHPCLGPLCPN